MQKDSNIFDNYLKSYGNSTSSYPAVGKINVVEPNNR